MKSIKTIFLVISFTSILTAQNEWVLQPWMQVEGTYNGQKLGQSVGFAGKVGDSTIITVGYSDGGENKIQILHIKTPDDTLPRYIYTGTDCSFGDFNGDEVEDLLVSGNPTKIYLGISPGVFDTIPFFLKHQEPEGYAFGKHVSVGKINDDSYDDLIITDAGYPGLDFIGRVYIFYGGVVMDTIPGYILNGDGIRVNFGWNVALGDLNHDSYDDIIVRGYDSNNPVSSKRFGYIKIFLGGNLIDTIAWRYIKGTNDLGDLASFDVNGDTIDDLLWSNIDSLSTVYIHYGNANGIDSLPDLRLNNPGIGGMGDVIVNGGDLNGDGYNDIVTGAPGHAQDLGFILVYSGGPNIDGNFDAAVGLSVISRFGQSMSSVGDINGDGLDDILVGAPNYKWDEYRGKWFIFLGDTNIPITSVRKEDFTQPKNFEL